MTLHHSLRASTQQQAAAPADPYFYLVTALFNGNGTNGAQNNTILDSSSNNFTVTVAGTVPSQGTFSPYSNLWSNYFNAAGTGTGTYVRTPTTGIDALRFYTGNFTVECWIYPAVQINTVAGVFGNYDALTGGGIHICIVSGNWYVYYTYGGTAIATGVTATLNAWSHVAVERIGTTLTVYINGTSVSTATDTQDYNTSLPFKAGELDGLTNQFAGFVSNARVVIGSAVYNGNFTPSTTPLTAVSGTQLLMCNTKRFEDSSSNNFTITSFGYTAGTTPGGPIVSRFSPFNPTASYTASSLGGSGYFISSPSMYAADNAALRLGTNAFTIEAWVYATESNVAGEKTIVAKGVATNDWYFSITNNNALRFNYRGTSVTSANNLVNQNRWNHVAAVRTNTSANGFKLYVNGVAVTTSTVATDLNQTEDLYIGLNRVLNTNVFRGYMCDLRIVNGTAVYNANFTPNTAPLTAITNTCLLCNFTNAGIFDLAKINNGRTFGNAQISTSVKKYGTGSLAFDGTGDYLSIPGSSAAYTVRPELQLSTGAFTIECWVYLNTTGVLQGIVAKGSGTTVGWSLQVSSGNAIEFRYGSSNLSTSPTTISSGSWYHLAVVRQSTATNGTKIYINGVNAKTGTVNTNFNQADDALVGNDRAGTAYLNGYIDDLRITKGLARYTADFTPPTAALPTY